MRIVIIPVACQCDSLAQSAVMVTRPGGWALHTSRCGAPSESLTWSDLTTKWKLSDFWSHLVLVNEVFTMLVTLLLRCKWSNDLDRHLGIINQNKSSIPLTQTAVFKWSFSCIQTQKPSPSSGLSLLPSSHPLYTFCWHAGFFVEIKCVVE